MTLPLSKRVQKVKPSPTLAVTARAAKLKAEGKDIIGLGAGEPDFDTPAYIAEAGIDAIRTRLHPLYGRRRHQRAQGRDHREIQARQRPELRAPQILVSSGAKQTLFNLCARCSIPATRA